MTDSLDLPRRIRNATHQCGPTRLLLVLLVLLSALGAPSAVAQQSVDSRRSAPRPLPADPTAEAPGEDPVRAGRDRPAASPLPAGSLPAPGSVRPQGERVTRDVRLLPASASVIRFRVDVPEPTFGVLEDETGVTTIEIPGYETHARVGDPAIPRRVVNVAVPPVGEVRVRATAAAADIRDGVVLAPSPWVSRDAPDEPRYARSGEAYWAGAPVAPERASLLGVSWMRNQRIARIEILPVDYEGSRGRLRVHRSVDVEVLIAPTGEVGRPSEPVDPFEGVYRGALVNYEQGKAWRRPAHDTPGARRFTPQHVQAVPTTSVFAGRLWAKIAIPSTGFYKISFSTLRNLAVFGGSTTTHADSVRLFNWPGRPVLPEADYCDSCDYREVAIQVVAGNDTLDDNADYVYFFAMGPSDWEDLYDPQLSDTVFLNNPYEDTNYYYLTVATAQSPVGGTHKRILTRSGAIGDPTGTTTPATFDARAHFELDAEYFPDPTPKISPSNPNTLFWEKWYWRSLNIGASFTVTADLPGIDVAQPARLRLSTWGIFSDPDTCFRQLLPGHFVDLTVNATSAAMKRGWNAPTGHIVDTTLAPGVWQPTGNQVRVEVPIIPTCPGRIDRVALAWFDVHFKRTFRALNDTLTFDSPVTAGIYVYRIPGFAPATPPRVFDVTDSYDPVEITGLEYVDQGGTYQMSFLDTVLTRRRYRVVQDESFVEDRDIIRTVDASTASLENLRQPPRDGMGAIIDVDYLVIYYDGFKAAADSLTEWRKTVLPLVGGVAPYGTYSVPISAVYDQFSGGRDDPAAIRNFLRAADANWGALGGKRPAFVTLLGDASHDFKDYLGRALPGQPGTLIPSYEGGYDIFVSRQYATDDWLLNVDDPVRNIPDFFGGRIPAADLNGALTYVLNKLLFYERQSPLGEWRNRVMFIGDDDKQGSSDDNLRWTHISQNSQLDTLVTPNHIDREYVYLHKYPDGPGDTKPGAKAAIIRTINQGALMVNFIGHGSPFKMTDESVFLDTDTGTLTNAERFTVFVAASCDIGKYNDPTVQSLGERLVLEPRGGAVGVVSATELALSNRNAQLNRILYTELFTRPSLGQGPYSTGVSQALNVAKLGGTTTEKYQNMADAGLQLKLPRLWVEFTLFDSAGTTPVTQIQRGQTITYRGQVVQWPGGPAAGFNGVAAVRIEDSSQLEQTPPCTFNPNCPLSTRPFYYFTPGPMFRGDVGVSNGAFEGRFIAPLEAKLGPRGRVRAYLSGEVAGQAFATDGVGDLRVQMSDGVQTRPDDRGPRITLSFPGGATAVKSDALLTVDLFDESGILTTGHTPQNSIVVTVDGNTTNRTDITESFRYAADSYQSGRATFKLPGLAEGAHRIEVTAADNLAAGLSAGAHRSTASLDFAVVSSPPLEISRAYLFPNPAESGGPRSGGQFVVDTPGDSVNVMVRLYTVTGKLIRVLKAFGGLGQVQLAWDGRDEQGYPLANGVYYFKVHVSPRAADGTSEAGRKATTEGRVVIVNRE